MTTVTGHFAVAITWTSANLALPSASCLTSLIDINTLSGRTLCFLFL